MEASLIVEVFLDRARVFGVLPNIGQNRRLVDVLNSTDLTFELQLAEARLHGGQQSQRYKSVTLKKQDVLYAIPRETQDQLRARALYRTGMSVRTTAPLPLSLLLPGYLVRGTAYVSPALANRATIDPEALPVFLPLTDATIGLADGTNHSEAVVIVNRAAVLALGRAAEA